MSKTKKKYRVSPTCVLCEMGSEKLSEHELQMLFDHIRQDNEQGMRCFGYFTVDPEGGIRANWADLELAQAVERSGFAEYTTTKASRLRTIQ